MGLLSTCRDGGVDQALVKIKYRSPIAKEKEGITEAERKDAGALTWTDSPAGRIGGLRAVATK